MIWPSLPLAELFSLPGILLLRLLIYPSRASSRAPSSRKPTLPFPTTRASSCVPPVSQALTCRMECLFLWGHSVSTLGSRTRVAWDGVLSHCQAVSACAPTLCCVTCSWERGQGSSFSIPTPHSIPGMLTPNRLSLGHTDTPRAREGQDKPMHTEWEPVQDQLHAHPALRPRKLAPTL